MWFGFYFDKIHLITNSQDFYLTRVTITLLSYMTAYGLFWFDGAFFSHTLA